MNRATKGALALLFVGLLVIGSANFLLSVREDRQQISTSDAARSKGSIAIGVDNFVGYFPLCSLHMRNLMLADGYLLECRDDQADYEKRFEALADGSIQFAVSTVDTYLLGGRRFAYPGIILTVIDESKGGDAIVASASAVRSLDDLKTKTDVKVAFTPSSPSHYLLKAVGVHFDIPLLLRADSDWRVETSGSSEALLRLQSGAAQVAALWEPDVSKALAQPGVVKLLGTEQTEKLIVDILLVDRKYHDGHPEVSRLLVANYFRTLKHYRDHADQFERDVAERTGLDTAQTKTMLGGVRWVTLHDNATLWYGLSTPGMMPSHGLFEAIESTLRILGEVGDVSGSPLPGGDPRRIINSSVVESLFTEGVGARFNADTSFNRKQVVSSLEKDFPSLSESAWSALREIGTLKIRPIRFRSGTGVLTLAGKEELDKAVETLKSYPNFRMVIEGHTNPKGNEEANKSLSQARAEAVSRYLQVTYRLDRDRLRASGLGSSRPLLRQPDETYRAFMDRLPRVELRLVSEVY